jgi:glycosyltransferase involved in cell wall biosynthesis
LRVTLTTSKIDGPEKSRRKSICLIVTSPLIIKFFLSHHIKELSKFADVTILLSSVEDGYINLEALPAKIIYIPITRKINPWKDLKSLFCIIKIFLASNFDLVQSVGPKAGLLGMISAKFCGIKHRIHYFQGEVWSSRKGLQKIILKACDKLTASLANIVLAVSPSESQFLYNEKVVSNKPPIVLGNGSICGVNFNKFKNGKKYRASLRSKFKFSPNQTLCLFVGRLCHDKGVLDLAHAWVRAKRKAPNLNLILVGSDEENIVPKIYSICREYKDSLHIFGHIDDTFPFYAMSDFLCLPSYREGLGMVILEAAAVGIPSVGSLIYGITDAILDGSTGLLFDVGNIEALSSCLLKLEGNVGQRLSYGHNARNRVLEKFNQKKVIEEYVKFIQGVLKLR